MSFVYTQPPLFDTHAHLDEPSLIEDQAAVLKLAEEQGLTGILTIGTTLQSSLHSLELAARHEQIFAAVGIHPNYTAQAIESDWQEIVKLSQRPDVVALGETGLDRYWTYSPIEQQQDYFERHLELSFQTGKPFIVHCRDAEEDVLAVLRKWSARGPLNGVMHSFCGSEEMARQCLDWGMLLSFSGMLTFKRNHELRELAKLVPLDRLLVETDSPYLAPQLYRGKRNQPGYVKHVAETLGDVKGLTYREICEITTANARRFLQLPLT